MPEEPIDIAIDNLHDVTNSPILPASLRKAMNSLKAGPITSLTQPFRMASLQKEGQTTTESTEGVYSSIHASSLKQVLLTPPETVSLEKSLNNSSNPLLDTTSEPPSAVTEMSSETENSSNLSLDTTSNTPFDTLLLAKPPFAQLSEKSMQAETGLESKSEVSSYAVLTTDKINLSEPVEETFWSKWKWYLQILLGIAIVLILLMLLMNNSYMHPEKQISPVYSGNTTDLVTNTPTTQSFHFNGDLYTVTSSNTYGDGAYPSSQFYAVNLFNTNGFKSMVPDGTQSAYVGNWGDYLWGFWFGNGMYSTEMDGKLYFGNWIQLQMPYSTYLTCYTLDQCHDSNPSRQLRCNDWSPAQFYVAGSNNGNSWSMIDSQMGIVWNNSPQTFTVTSAHTDYLYYRLIITACAGGGAIAGNLFMTLWQLSGYATNN